MLIRAVCGVLGVLGTAAIAFEAVRDGEIRPGILLFAKLLAAFVFLFVAIFGTNPLPGGSRDAD